MSASIFAPVRIGNLESPNRFVRSATWEGLATDDGLATPALADVLGALARGGVGVVIPGHAYVEKRGQAGPRQLGIHDDACIPGLRMLADAVHAGGGRIVAQ
ncbi:NADH:flavin oxidoreductase, partial [Desulfovibrio sp. XJ01]|nr:NADH:flavin oxidoreductase [Nitratidesulfovibrio liaohensis]